MEEIDPRKLLIKVVQILERLNIPYIITGGMAVFVWGRPRYTADIDMVVEMQAEKVEDLAEELMKLGETGYVDTEAIREALKTEGEFNFVDGTTGMKVDFWILKKEPFDQSRLQRRVAKEVLGEQVYFSSPEDLILMKLLWARDSVSTRQLEDVESVLAISKGEIDMGYLTQWAKELGVQDILHKLLKS
ncbi:MAG: nucleotidyltransferase [bacterium]|nr:nucleotidyltransferase [bacterium]